MTSRSCPTSPLRTRSPPGWRSHYLADGCGPTGPPRPTRIASDGRGVYEDVAGPVYGLLIAAGERRKGAILALARRIKMGDLVARALGSCPRGRHPRVSGARLWTRFLGRDGQVPLTPGVTHCVLPLSGRIGKKCSGVLGIQSRAALVSCLETLALMVGE